MAEHFIQGLTRQQIESVVAAALLEDAPAGDLTSQLLIPESASAVATVGAREPGIARGMGLKTRATFEEALADAKKKFVGENPNILALPKAFTTAAVHRCMKDSKDNSHFRDDAPAHPCGC